MNVTTKLPLSRLVTPGGDATRVGDIGGDAVRNLLRQGTVRFVVADVGSDLRWLPEAECFDVWKREVQPHLAEPSQQVHVEQFPNEYAYFGSRWDDGSAPIILLAKAH